MGAPQTIGPLVVVRRLGGGAYGEVLEVRDPRTGERLALKRLRAGIEDAIDLERFRREAAIMQKLKHPNLMPVLHVELRAMPPYYLMPYRDGETLETRLRKGALPPPIVARIARDAAFGLAEAGRRGVVHRDLKPSNLFVEANGRTEVLDFGLAKSIADDVLALTKTGMIVGTPAYMSPEQCRGEPVTDRTDVYALGVTIAEMLLGKNPFEAPDIVQTLQRHLDAVPRRLDALMPHRVRPEFGEIVHRMLQKLPEHRPRMDSCLEAFAGIARSYERRVGTWPQKRPPPSQLAG